MTCYRDGGCGPYEMRSCNECPASKPEYKKVKCDCYSEEEQIIGWHTPVDPKIKIVYRCNGTRERDECSCGGDRAKCDFYPEIRAKNLTKKELLGAINICLSDAEEMDCTLCPFYDDKDDDCRYRAMTAFKKYLEEG